MFWLVTAELLLNVARGILNLALGLFLYRTTGELWAFALAFTSEFAFALVIQGFAGAVADRFQARNVLALASGISALLFPVILGIALLHPAGGFDDSAAYALGLSLGLNLTRPFIRTAVFAVSHQVVSERGYERLNSSLAIALQVGQLAGMGLAGVLLETLPSAQVFAVIGALQACVALLHVVFRQRVPCAEGLEASPSQPGKPALSTVVAHVRANPLILSICAIATVDVALVALFNLSLAPVVAAGFGGHARWMTILDMSFAAGALLGGGYLSARKLPIGMRVEPTLVAILSGAATFACFTFAAPAWLLLPTIALFGFLATVSTVVWQSGLQLVAPATMKGRLGSLRFLCNSAVIAVATLLASYVNDLRLISVSGFAVLFALTGLVAVGHLAGRVLAVSPRAAAGTGAPLRPGVES